eukprot:scpid73588/ scgid25374/ 
MSTRVVTEQLSARFNTHYSWSKISNFEHRNSKEESFCEHIRKWIEDEDVAVSSLQKSSTGRIHFDKNGLKILEQAYIENQNPKGEWYDKIAKQLNCDSKKIRQWFATRRSLSRKM